MKKLLTIAISMAIVLPALAQGGHPQHRANRGDWEQRIQSEKIAFFTSELDLTPEEAQVFWPLYNQYWKDCMESHKNTMKYLKLISGKEGEKPTEAKMTEYTDSYVNALAEEQKVLGKYYPEFKKVLPIEKVGRLFIAEEKFRMKMIHGLKERPHKGKM